MADRSAYLREWRKANPERYQESNRNHKAKRRGAEGRHTAKDIREIFVLQKGRCAVCRCRLDGYHVDHIVPLAAGGTNNRQNIQLACLPCNLAKGARDPINFMQSLGRLL